MPSFPRTRRKLFFAYRKGNPVTYTNADVVSYNKYLLFKYNCRINVEYCHSVKAIKYHLKYINKGADEATVTLESKANCPDDDSKKTRMHQEMKSKSFRTNSM